MARKKSGEEDEEDEEEEAEEEDEEEKTRSTKLSAWARARQRSALDSAAPLALSLKDDVFLLPALAPLALPLASSTAAASLSKARGGLASSAPASGAAAADSGRESRKSVGSAACEKLAPQSSLRGTAAK